MKPTIELSDDLLVQLMTQFKRPDDLGFLEFIIRSRPHLLLKEVWALKEIIFNDTGLTILLLKSMQHVYENKFFKETNSDD